MFLYCRHRSLSPIFFSSPCMADSLKSQIFVSRAQVRDEKCQHSSSIDLLFSDDAKDWVLSYANIPETGSFRPANSLMDTFDNIPIHGEWRISIAMAQLEYAEENNGARCKIMCSRSSKMEETTQPSTIVCSQTNAHCGSCRQ